jgi:hypothetical protein
MQLDDPRFSSNELQTRRNKAERFYELAKENLYAFVTGTLGSFGVGAAIKYIGRTDLMNPLVFGPIVTAVEDLAELVVGHERIKTVIKDDIGYLAGTTLGWTLASLLPR